MRPQQRPRQLPRQRPEEGGFTLIELLMVIGLIGILMVALLPMLATGSKRAEETETRTRIQLLEQLVSAFANSPFGDYPPDDFKDPPSSPIWKPLATKVDNVNAGIESCLVFLHRDEHRGKGLEEHVHDWLRNTDGDKADAVLGKLGTNEKLELVDSWGTPIAYFHSRNYAATQEYLGPNGPVTATAWKSKDGGFINKRSFQIFSAGLDGVFNTNDDVSVFQKF